ncbi:uncharacterized protein ACBT44_005734 [Syngnathus typhle]
MGRRSSEVQKLKSQEPVSHYPFTLRDCFHSVQERRKSLAAEPSLAQSVSPCARPKVSAAPDKAPRRPDLAAVRTLAAGTRPSGAGFLVALRRLPGNTRMCSPLAALTALKMSSKFKASCCLQGTQPPLLDKNESSLVAMSPTNQVYSNHGSSSDPTGPAVFRKLGYTSTVEALDSIPISLTGPK